MTEATRIQALYRGWSSRQLISLSKDNVDEHCCQIENLIRLEFREYGHKLEKSNHTRIDLVGEIPLFGHYVVVEPGKFVADIHNTFKAVCSTDEPTFADVNCVDGALTKIRDNSNARAILPAFDHRIDTTDDESRTDALMTDHLPISDDLSKLRAEEIWLENAIRERISVCTNFRKSSLVM